ncbi:MAG: flagellar biosynthesis anti-sigma factor FlgM [Proteobacteria bacterium]|nr:flagellar biosynthesis anti-sigma factor FlgM [Pseudomonadota bacterium]
MKVSNNVPMNPQVIEKSKESTPQAKTALDTDRSGVGGARSGASVEISERAKLMKQAMETAQNTPDIRRDKVEMLKKSIREGTYHVDSAAIADRLVDEHLRNDFGKNTL